MFSKNQIKRVLNQNNIRVSNKALRFIQEYLEKHILEIGNKAKFLTENRKQKIVQEKDFKTIIEGM